MIWYYIKANTINLLNIWWWGIDLWTELKADKTLIQVKSSKPIPANSHSYKIELDDNHKVAEGVAAVRQIYYHPEGYKTLKAA